jgi:hypothetical protein
MGARFHHDLMPGDIDQALDPARDHHILVSGQLTFDHQGRSHASAFLHCEASSF